MSSPNNSGLADDSSYDEQLQSSHDTSTMSEENVDVQHSFAVQDRTTDRRPSYDYLFPVFGRLEHVSLADDFRSLYCLYADCVKGFMADVLKELKAYMKAHPKRNSGEDIILAYEYLVKHVGDSSIPSSFLFDPGNAWPMGVLFLVCQFVAKAECTGGTINATKEEKNASVEEKRKVDLNYQNLCKTLRTSGIFVVGKGALAAFAVSMAPNKGDLPRTTAEMYVAAFDVGMSHRYVFRNVFGRHFTDSCSIFTVGLTMMGLRVLLQHVNKGSYVNGRFFPPYSVLVPTTIFSAHCIVVSGHPIDLTRLRLILRAYSQKTGARVKFVDIQESCPQNHHYLNDSVYYDLLVRWQNEGVVLDQKRLSVAVFSPVTGTKWDKDCKCPSFLTFQQEVAFALTCDSHVLWYSMQHMDTKHDFMVSVGGEHFNIADVLMWEMEIKTLCGWETDLEKYCMGETLYSDSIGWRHEFFFTPKRSITPKGVRKNLERMALINRVWKRAYPHKRSILDDRSSLVKVENADSDDETDENGHGVDTLSAEILSVSLGSVSHQRGNAHTIREPSVEEPRYYSRFIQLLKHEIPVDVEYLKNAQTVKQVLDLWMIQSFLNTEWKYKVASDSCDDRVLP